MRSGRRPCSRRRPEVSAEQASRFGEVMWGGDFVGAVRGFVASIATPIAVLPGIDQIHPTHIGLEIAELAPSATLIDYWRVSPEETARAAAAVRDYLKAHRPRLVGPAQARAHSPVCRGAVSSIGQWLIKMIPRPAHRPRWSRPTIRQDRSAGRCR